MNYEKIYNKIVKRGKFREITGYVEIHHIIPKCIGGNDEIYNLVKLTAKEHFICHKLLTEIHPNENKLHYAVMMMATMKNAFGRDYRVGAREYNRLKESVIRTAEHCKNLSLVNSGKVLSEKTKRKISKSLTGKTVSDETKVKMSKSKLGILFSNEHKQNIRIAVLNMSDETKAKMSKSAKNRLPISDDTRIKMSIANSNPNDETRKKLSESHKGKKQKIIKCPHCGKEGGNATMPRWHFDNCKQKI